MNMASPHDMHAAVQAAKNTLYSWSQNTTPEQRIADVRQLLLLIYEVYIHDLGPWISTEMGSPLQAAIPESDQYSRRRNRILSTDIVWKSISYYSRNALG